MKNFLLVILVLLVVSCDSKTAFKVSLVGDVFPVHYCDSNGYNLPFTQERVNIPKALRDEYVCTKYLTNSIKKYPDL